MPEPAKVTDKDVFTQQLEVSVNFDANGEVIYPDGDDDFEDDTLDFFDDPDPDSIIYQVNATPTFVWELGDCILFDVQEIKKSDIEYE